MNLKPNKNSQSGKFQKSQTSETMDTTDREFILYVKDRLYQGYTDLEEIKLAYYAIVGSTEYPMNVTAMRRAIINYN